LRYSRSPRLFWDSASGSNTIHEARNALKSLRNRRMIVRGLPKAVGRNGKSRGTHDKRFGKSSLHERSAPSPPARLLNFENWRVGLCSTTSSSLAALRWYFFFCIGFGVARRAAGCRSIHLGSGSSFTGLALFWVKPTSWFFLRICTGRDHCCFLPLRPGESC
jgi:hypothetical protein